MCGYLRSRIDIFYELFTGSSCPSASIGVLLTTHPSQRSLYLVLELGQHCVYQLVSYLQTLPNEYFEVSSQKLSFVISLLKNFESLTMPKKKQKGGTIWDFSNSILSQNSKKMKGTLWGIFRKKSHNAEKKPERGEMTL